MVKASVAKRALFREMNRVRSRPKVKKSIQTEVKRQVLKNKENKFLDTDHNFNFDVTMEVPSTGQLALIPQNDTASGREGRQVQLNSVWIKLQLTYTSPVVGSAGGGNDMCYLWLVVDHSPNKATASVDAPGSGIFTSNIAPSCQLNMFADNRYTIIKKWNLLVPEFGFIEKDGANVQVAHRYVEEYIKFKKPIVQIYDNSVATGAITSLMANSLFFVAGNSTYATSDDFVSVIGSSRVRFTEL